MGLIQKLFNIKVEPTSTINVVFKNIYPYWFIFLVLLPLIIIYCWTIYKKERIDVGVKSRGVVGLLTILRVVCILLIFLFIWEPVIVIKDYYFRKAKFIFLIDDSASMSVKDKYEFKERTEIAKVAGLTKRGFFNPERINDMNRLEIVKEVMTNFVPSLEEYKKHYDFSFYSFSKETKSINEFSHLTPIGEYTAIGEAIKNVMYEQRGSLVRGIAIISDGVNNAGESPVTIVERMSSAGGNLPIFTIGVGTSIKPKDVALANLVAPDEVSISDIVEFSFNVFQSGYDGQTMKCNLEMDGKEISTKDVTLISSGQESSPEVFKYKPEKEGEFEFVIKCPPYLDETDKTNNELKKKVKIHSKVIRLLYIEKWPRFEYRALKDLVIRDPKNYEAQFWLVETSELFEQEYTRNEKNTVKPLEELPTTKQELYSYDAIIIGDVETADLKPPGAKEDFMENLYKYVFEYGGGVAFIAGSNMPIAFKGTPIAKLFPFTITGEEVVVSSIDENEETKIDFVLTPEGEQSKIFRLSEDEEEKRELFGDSQKKEDRRSVLSGFYSFVPIKRLNMGQAEVLAYFVDPLNRFGENVKLPFVISYTLGSYGRTLFIATDEMWRWREYFGSRYHGRFWAQILNYLKGAYKRRGRRFNISIDKKEYSVGEDVKISIKAYNKDYTEMQVDEIPIIIFDPDSKTIDIKAKKTSPGNYSYIFKPEKEGHYTVSVESAFAEEEVDKLPFQVKSVSLEFINPIMDKELLQSLAIKSKGNFYYIWEIDKLKEIFESIPEEALQVSKITERELWNSKLFFFLFLILISAEWIIRKLVRLL
jgi:hypothetical protein